MALPKVSETQINTLEIPTKIKIWWGAVTPPVGRVIEGYDVKRRVLGETVWSIIANTTLNEYIDDSLAYGTIYEYVIATVYTAL